MKKILFSVVISWYFYQKKNICCCCCHRYETRMNSNTDRVFSDWNFIKEKINKFCFPSFLDSSWTSSKRYFSITTKTLSIYKNNIHFFFWLKIMITHHHRHRFLMITVMVNSCKNHSTRTIDQIERWIFKELLFIRISNKNYLHQF